MTRRPEEPEDPDVRSRAAAERDDAGDDTADAQLGAMRAAWRSMREEEPPDSGLADLLTAARQKAAAMRARPTLRERVLAVVRRPPALAFATVVVLIGGALMIGRSHMRATHRAASSTSALQEPARPLAPPQAADDGVAGQAASVVHELGTAASGGSVLRRAGGPREQADLPAGDRAESAEPVDGDAPDGAAAGLRGAGMSRGKSAVERAFDERSEAMRGGDLAGSADGARGKAPGGIDGSETENLRDRAGGLAEVPARRAAEDGAARAPSTSTAQARPEAFAREQRARLDHLYRQCSSAARRGDCAAVRRLVEAFAKSDHGERAGVVRDAAVAKCLAE